MPYSSVFLTPSLVTSGIAMACAVFLGCTPAIGDRCAVSSDCSIQGNRTCDSSQPNGYCTVLGCAANSCPDNAACVVYGASVPGCPYDDYRAPSRTGRALCLKTCGSDSDCRQGDGYSCAQLPQLPWNAGPPWTAVLDNRTSTRVCIIAPNSAPPPMNVDVCSSSRPVASWLDAMVTLVDAPPDMGDAAALESDASADTGNAGAADASADAGDAGAADVSADGGTAGAADVIQEATADSGALDAPSG